MNKFFLACTFILICLSALTGFSQTQPKPSPPPAEIAETDSVSKTDPIEVRKAFFSTFYQNGEKLPASMIREVVADNPAARRQMRRARQNYLAAMAVNTTGAFLVAYPVASALFGDKANWRLLALGAGLIGTGIPLTKAYFRHAEAAASIHNQSLGKSAVERPQLQLGLTGQGFGLHFRF
jgi:hypothetical protein